MPISEREPEGFLNESGDVTKKMYKFLIFNLIKKLKIKNLINIANLIQDNFDIHRNITVRDTWLNININYLTIYTTEFNSIESKFNILRKKI
jgi:hypothetical protein